MPVLKKKNKAKEENNKSKSSSPFKDIALFEKEITAFANKYKTIVVNQTKRISDYFEMTCFNYIVHYYELQGYTLEVKNLQTGKYRYKCSPAGIQSNFSNFEASIQTNGEMVQFEIQHNLAVQSSHDTELFTTPDIAIIRKGKVKYTKDYYDTKTTFSYVKNNDLMTFCEVKQFNPFPELLFNFIGVLNEIKKDYMDNNGKELTPIHIAPSLMISGKPNKQTNNIKRSLENRYCINIIYDLFYSATLTFSKRSISKLRRSGKIPVALSIESLF